MYFVISSYLAKHSFLVSVTNMTKINIVCKQNINVANHYLICSLNGLTKYVKIMSKLWIYTDIRYLACATNQTIFVIVLSDVLDIH